ncbi:hypothetical protein SDC9_202038 [bioreactor metagenome]|uniref:Uncharacterized protein n=1 Tax=bioreactor metagenome TaxID=1076179 RepID=A0A645ISK8_9ZZZZ
MYIGDFLGGNPFCDEFVPYVVVDIEAAVILRRGQVAENKLRRAAFGVFLPKGEDILGTG